MKIIFKAFAKKFFGAGYERLTRTLFIYLIVFWGLYIADFKIQIASFILYLMVSTFTAGVMWQALSSKEDAANMQNMFMLPFDCRKLVFAYVAALGAYTLLTKTAGLLAVVLAVSVRTPAEIIGSVLCTINAVLTTAAVYSLKQYRYMGIIWASGLAALILSCGDKQWFIPVLAANSIFAAIALQKSDGYAFYLQTEKNRHTVKIHKHCSVWIYLFRYLNYHKNYMINTAVMWCVACVMPLFFKQPESRLFAVPIGFAILSLNTPVCILLSCDPELQQAVRFLPHQKKAFCVPYLLFIFLCNMTANTIFLCSLQIQNGGVTLLMIAEALFFALQSAVCSVLLEWFYPIRNWTIESDLWHHPRKYIVPVVMLLLAGVVGTLPVLIPVLLIMLIVEIIILLSRC